MQKEETFLETFFDQISGLQAPKADQNTQQLGSNLPQPVSLTIHWWMFQYPKLKWLLTFLYNKTCITIVYLLLLSLQNKICFSFSKIYEGHLKTPPFHLETQTKQDWFSSVQTVVYTVLYSMLMWMSIHNCM